MRVGVAGLGKMGEPIARRLLDAGHELSVWNRSAGRADRLVEQGAREVSSPGDVWEGADVCITMVLDDDALRAVTLGDAGLLNGPPEGRALVDMSTVSPAVSAEVADAASAAGITFLRAPVSGNPTVVEAGNLGIMVSGDEGRFRELEPMLRDIGPNIFYVGGADEARTMKLALQLMIAASAQMMAEAIVLGEAGGLDRATLLEVMAGTAVGSPFVKYKAGPLVADDYSPTFTTGAMHKDLALVLAAADERAVPLPITALIQDLLRGCMAAGMTDLDFSALLPRLQRDAGLEPAVGS